MSITRRQFLKNCGLTAAAVGMFGADWRGAEAAATVVIDPAGPNLLLPNFAVLVTPGGQSAPTVPWAMVRTGQALQWHISVPQSGYYELGVTWRDSVLGWGMRAEVMLGDRVLAVLYDHSSSGAVRLQAGEYDVAVRNLYWPLVMVRSLFLELTPAPFAEPVATFCVVQDWHTDAPAPPPSRPRLVGLYNCYPLPSEAPACNHQILTSIQSLHPDFLVGNGDNVMWGSRTSLIDFAHLMSGLPFPWYATLGHHETRNMVGARRFLKAAWGPAVPGDATWYYFDQAGIRFVFMDSAYFGAANGAMFPFPSPDWIQVGCLPVERAWLQAVLSDNRLGLRLPVVVFTHHTVPPYRPVPPTLAAVGAGYKTRPPGDAADMLAILGADPNVRAVFSGHAHFQQVLTLGNITHVQGAATGEGAMSYLRTLVFSDHLEVETYQPVSQNYLISSLIGLNGWVVGYPPDMNTSITLTPPSSG